MVIMSLKNVTKTTSQNFFQFAPPHPIKFWLRQCCQRSYLSLALYQPFLFQNERIPRNTGSFLDKTNNLNNASILPLKKPFFKALQRHCCSCKKQVCCLYKPNIYLHIIAFAILMVKGVGRKFFRGETTEKRPEK